uniref:Uncharacterized protein n=1 Tax=Photinus pyralis TaxID=7054 RepID=A0A1Y1MJ51_PHOPY
MLSSFHHVICNITTSIPHWCLPRYRQGINSNIIDCWESRWIWSVANLDFNNGGVLTQIVLGRNPVWTTVKSTTVSNCKNGVAIFDLNMIVSSRLDGLSFSHPGDSWLGIASEWNLNNNIFTFIKERSVTEAWWYIQFRCGHNNKFRACRFDATFIYRPTHVFIGVFAKYIVYHKALYFTFAINMITSAITDFSSSLVPSNCWFGHTGNCALEFRVMVLNTVRVLKRFDYFWWRCCEWIHYFDGRRRSRWRRNTGNILSEYPKLVLAAFDQVWNTNLRRRTERGVDTLPGVAIYLSFLYPVAFDSGTTV